MQCRCSSMHVYCAAWGDSRVSKTTLNFLVPLAVICNHSLGADFEGLKAEANKRLKGGHGEAEAPKKKKAVSSAAAIVRRPLWCRRVADTDVMGMPAAYCLLAGAQIHEWSLVVGKHADAGRGSRSESPAGEAACMHTLQSCALCSRCMHPPPCVLRVLNLSASSLGMYAMSRRSLAPRPWKSSAGTCVLRSGQGRSTR